MRHQSGDTVAGADMGGLPQYTSIQSRHPNTARAPQHSPRIHQDPIRPNTATTKKLTAISTTASQARPLAPSSSKARPSAPPTPARTPAQTPPRSRPPGTPSPTPPKSPPGFPSTPQYHNSPHIDVSLAHSDLGQITQMSPLSANLRILSSVFKDADVQPDLCKERLALFECDVDGDIEVDTNGKNTFYLTGGFVYRSGHGREKCSMAKCLNTKEDVPNNCGFHGQFILPNWFKPCGPSCRGGYCLCLRFYDSYLCKYL